MRKFLIPRIGRGIGKKVYGEYYSKEINVAHIEIKSEEVDDKIYTEEYYYVNGKYVGSKQLVEPESIIYDTFKEAKYRKLKILEVARLRMIERITNEINQMVEKDKEEIKLLEETDFLPFL